nr:hypothetical protein [uncultured Mediterraneibacter sp.]
MGKNLNTENRTRQKIKSFLAMNGCTLKEVVEKMNANHPDTPTTAQNITNKLARETIKFSEVVEIAELLGYSVEFIPRNRKMYFPASEERNNKLEQIAVKAEEDVIKIPSPNFGETIIYGTNAQAAADQLMKQPTLSKSAEILLQHRLQKELNVLISVTNSHVNQ